MLVVFVGLCAAQTTTAGQEMTMAETSMGPVVTGTEDRVEKKIISAII